MTNQGVSFQLPPGGQFSAAVDSHPDSAIPVRVWQGPNDRMVPYEHGVWLAGHIPGSPAHLREDEGHVSLVVQLPRILTHLDDLAG